jgi:hypothetical protein
MIVARRLDFRNEGIGKQSERTTKVTYFESTRKGFRRQFRRQFRRGKVAKVISCPDDTHPSPVPEYE